MIKFLAFFTETIAWLQIMASPFLIGLGLAFIEYNVFTNRVGFITAIVIAASGLLIGIIFATRIWRKKGTVEFMSGSSKNEEIDDVPGA